LVDEGAERFNGDFGFQKQLSIPAGCDFPIDRSIKYLAVPSTDVSVLFGLGMAPESVTKLLDGLI